MKTLDRVFAGVQIVVILLCLFGMFAVAYHLIAAVINPVYPPYCECFGYLEKCGPYMQKCQDALRATQTAEALPTPTPPWWQFWGH